MGNTNMLAPIMVQMWKTWVGLTNSNIDNLKKQALNNVGVLKAHVDLLPTFSQHV
jgi:hypothetical protein